MRNLARDGWKIGLATLCIVGANALTACNADSGNDAPGDDTSSSSSSGGSSGANSSSSSSSSSSGASSSSSSSSGSGNGSSSGGSSGSVEQNLTADITEQRLEADWPCRLYVIVPIVDAHSAAANTAIAQVMPQFDRDQRCEGAEDGDVGFDFWREYTTLANAWGLLSIQQLGSDGLAGDYDEFVKGRNFDIASGASLRLTSVIDPTGIATIRSACISTATGPGLPYDSDVPMATQACDEALAAAEPNFQIEPSGLRLYMDYPYYSMTDGEASKNGALIPWSALQGTILSPLVQSYLTHTN